MTGAPTLVDAIAHLKQVRAGLEASGEADPAAQQTAAALDVVIAQAESEHKRTAEDAIADKLGDLA